MEWSASWIIIDNKTKSAVKKAINNNNSTDLKFSKAHNPKIIQSEGFLGSLLSTLASPLMNAAVSLAKNILLLLEITAAASVTDRGIQKKIHGSRTARLARAEYGKEWDFLRRLTHWNAEVLSE